MSPNRISRGWTALWSICIRREIAMSTPLAITALRERLGDVGRNLQSPGLAAVVAQGHRLVTHARRGHQLVREAVGRGGHKERGFEVPDAGAALSEGAVDGSVDLGGRLGELHPQAVRQGIRSRG